MDRYAGLWDAAQEAAGVANDGAFRKKVNTTRVWGVVCSYGPVRVDHYKKNSNGKYKEEKAARIEIEGTAFAGISGGPVQPFELAKVETNAKKCKASFTYFGLADIPFVEGCGCVSPNSKHGPARAAATIPAGTPTSVAASPGDLPGGGFGGGGTGGGGEGG